MNVGQQPEYKPPGTLGYVDYAYARQIYAVTAAQTSATSEKGKKPTNSESPEKATEVSMENKTTTKPQGNKDLKCKKKNRSICRDSEAEQMCGSVTAR